jgi:hypothetical protein
MVCMTPIKQNHIHIVRPLRCCSFTQIHIHCHAFTHIFSSENTISISQHQTSIDSIQPPRSQFVSFSSGTNVHHTDSSGPIRENRWGEPVQVKVSVCEAYTPSDSAESERILPIIVIISWGNLKIENKSKQKLASISFNRWSLSNPCISTCLCFFLENELDVVVINKLWTNHQQQMRASNQRRVAHPHNTHTYKQTIIPRTHTTMPTSLTSHSQHTRNRSMH